MSLPSWYYYVRYQERMCYYTVIDKRLKLIAEKNRHKPHFIYIITCKENNKKYVGMTTDFARRRWQHLNNLRSNRHQNTLLQADFNKYGEDAFIFEVLKEVKGEKEAIKAEHHQIKKLNLLEDGYNSYKMIKTAKKRSLCAAIDHRLIDIIRDEARSSGMTEQEWLRIAALEKAKRDGLL